MKKGTFQHLLSLLTVLLMLVAVAVNRDGRLLGHSLHSDEPATEQPEAVTTQADGSVVVRTATIARDVQGYGGPTPIVITIKDGVVTSVEAEPNNESPEFFGQAFSHFVQKWTGKSVAEIAAEPADAVTGATLSSRALQGNIAAAIQAVDANAAATATSQQPWSAKGLVVLMVVALGCVLPLFAKLRRYRTWWLAVNVVVLGLWSGTFLSHALLVNWLSSGTHLLASLPVVLMLVAAFIYPLFGKKSYYCTWICPMGSLQELMGKTSKRKIKISAKTVKCLTVFNELLWATLMLLMLTGVWSAWMDYELFTAFLFTTASPVVIGFAVAFVVLSAFVPRPYCRFVCPTGCMLRVAQNTKRQ